MNNFQNKTTIIGINMCWPSFFLLKEKKSFQKSTSLSEDKNVILIQSYYYYIIIFIHRRAADVKSTALLGALYWLGPLHPMICFHSKDLKKRHQMAKFW